MHEAHSSHRRASLRGIFVPLIQLLNRRTILILTLLLCAGIAGALWNMAQLSSSLMRSQAVASTTLYAQAIQEARTLYNATVVDQIKHLPDIKIGQALSPQPGEVPLPASYLIELGDRLSRNSSGMSVRLYSDYPFPNRQQQGGPRDDYERLALQSLRANPTQPFIRFESYQGRLSIRYAQADIMQPTCVECHNARTDSPKRDWRVGDVRGVLEITTPLDGFMAQTNAGLRNMFLTLAGMSFLGLAGIAIVIGRLRQTSRELELRVIDRTSQLQAVNQSLLTEKEKSENLLLNILPPPIAERLKAGHHRIADGFASVTILFADLVNFTQLSEELSPSELVALLNEIFSAFDRLTEKYGLEKIKTIGDAYMAVGGLPRPSPDHAEAIAEMAIAMQREIEHFNQRHHHHCQLRIGINTGPVVAGVIGTKKFIYDLWGDTVNIASRMESHGIPGEIQVTQATYECLKHRYTFKYRGEIMVKGKGATDAYLLIGHRTATRLEIATPVA